MIQPRIRRFVRRLLVRGTSKGRERSAKSILPGPIRRRVARLLAAAVPRNASGNNASVR